MQLPFVTVKKKKRFSGQGKSPVATETGKWSAIWLPGGNCEQGCGKLQQCSKCSCAFEPCVVCTPVKYHSQWHQKFVCPGLRWRPEKCVIHHKSLWTQPIRSKCTFSATCPFLKILFLVCKISTFVSSKNCSKQNRGMFLSGVPTAEHASNRKTKVEFDPTELESCRDRSQLPGAFFHWA